MGRVRICTCGSLCSSLSCVSPRGEGVRAWVWVCAWLPSRAEMVAGEAAEVLVPGGWGGV